MIEIILIFLTVSLVLICAGIYSIFERKHCTETIDAVYVGYKTYYTGKMLTYYIPKFTYCYNGYQYTRTVSQTYSLAKLCKLYQEGQFYKVYINPKNPNMICVSRKFPMKSVWLIGFGVVLLAVVILKLCPELESQLHRITGWN